MNERLNSFEIPAPEDRLQLVATIEEATAHIDVNGDIDPLTAEYFERTVAAVVDSQEVQKVLLGFEQVSFVEAEGLKALVDLKRHADASQKELAIQNPTLGFVKMLKITGLDQFLTVITDKPE